MTTTESSIISGVIDVWRRFGVFDFILPFLLVFSIVYGILEKVQLFGDKAGTRVNAIIAFTIAMISTLTGWFISFITGYLPWVSTISIVVITVLMLVALFYGDFNSLLNNKKALGYGALVIVITIGIVLAGMGAPFLAQLRIGEFLNSIGLKTTDLWGLVFFGGFIATIFLIGRTKTTPPISTASTLKTS